MVGYGGYDLRLYRCVSNVEVSRFAADDKSMCGSGMKLAEDALTNSQIAELLAIAAEDAAAPLNRAYRRASRKALPM
jgi:hypothetical protein